MQCQKPSPLRASVQVRLKTRRMRPRLQTRNYPKMHMSRHRLEASLLERKPLHLTKLYRSSRFRKVKRLHRPQTLSHRKKPHLTQPHRPKQRLRLCRTTLILPLLRKRLSVIHRRARTARSIADVAASQLTWSICSRPRNCVVKEKKYLNAM